MRGTPPKGGGQAHAPSKAEERRPLFAGQKPYPTWPQSLPPRNDPAGDPPATDPLGTTSNGIVAKAHRSFIPPIVLGISFVVAALVGFLVMLTLRPAPVPPRTVAALPMLEAAPPATAVATSNSPDQPINAEERLATLEPPSIQIGVPQQDSSEAALPSESTPLARPQPSPREATSSVVLAPLPPSRPLEFAPPASPPTGYDQTTAVYDISAHTVYLPDGMRLEAHSGLGDRIDDPRFVDERDHGATPPGVYQLTLRESLFHGVQALRLTPISGGFTFNRVGLLAHPYMLGPNGDSNGCVSFKNYDVFLRAFQSGGVKRLAVVAQWAGRPRQFGLLASLRQTPNQ